MHRRRQGFYLWIELGILSLLFGLFAYSFQKLLTHEKALPTPTIAEISHEDLQREPASAPTQTTAENILEIGCLQDSPQPITTKEKNVRLSATICQKNPWKLKSSLVKNLTTGQEITGIPAEDMKKFATDFFPLSPGSNQLVIELKEANGKTLLRNLTINLEM